MNSRPGNLRRVKDACFLHDNVNVNWTDFPNLSTVLPTSCHSRTPTWSMRRTTGLERSTGFDDSIAASRDRRRWPSSQSAMTFEFPELSSGFRLLQALLCDCRFSILAADLVSKSAAPLCNDWANSFDGECVSHSDIAFLNRAKLQPRSARAGTDERGCDLPRATSSTSSTTRSESTVT